ncbi:disulfide bond formation protein B [Niveibacterium sp. SC-1]|uniref:disulfide bond formation protein B n=1 Tax=Niveibacterium sp. SC-1 TaxID=3135646 RepID=UPI00311E50CF
MLAKFSPRQRLGAVALICIGLLGFGVVLQQWKHVEPCPMCIMQRYAFVAVALFALIGATLRLPLGGQKTLAALSTLAGLIGLGIGVRQSWLQWFPPKFLECGPDLEYLINSFPLGQALPKIFAGSGDCSRVDWTFLGLSIANWAVIWFAICAVITLSVVFARNPRR